MSFIIKNFKWVMLVSGLLTATMFYGLFAPEAALRSMFGASFNGSLELIIVRSWSALIGLIGVLLIWGAFNERNRVFAVTIASISKAIFVALVLLYGQPYLASAAAVVALDIVVVLLTVVFLGAVQLQRSSTRLRAAASMPAAEAGSPNATHQ